jgi:hypothetical protein
MRNPVSGSTWGRAGIRGLPSRSLANVQRQSAREDSEAGQASDRSEGEESDHGEVEVEETQVMKVTEVEGDQRWARHGE